MIADVFSKVIAVLVEASTTPSPSPALSSPSPTAATPSVINTVVSASDPWTNPALWISVFALLFTIVSFYWLQARRGKVISFAPRSYAGAFLPNELRLVLPLVLHNTGPAPLSVMDFRLHVSKMHQEDGDKESQFEPFYLSWHAIQLQLDPKGSNGGERVMPSPIVLNGRVATERFIEFGTKTRSVSAGDGPYQLRVEVLLAHRSSWTTLAAFPLHSELMGGDKRAFTPYTNDPDWKH